MEMRKLRVTKAIIEEIADSVQFDLYDKEICQIGIKELTRSLTKAFKEVGLIKNEKTTQITT
ncbi:MAG: hypothetical protein V3V81_08220 [Candidatus Bathyarchaeia archaeon]